MDQILFAEALCTTITPLLPHLFVKAFGESFRQPVSDGFRHDRVVVVVLGPELVAQLLQADSAGYGECTDMIGQSGFLRRDEVSERSARLTPFFVRLLAEEMK